MRNFWGGQMQLIAEELATAADATPAAAGVDIRRLRTALDRLSMQHREILLLHDAEEYKLIEIQQLTGIPVGTLKSRLHRARARLRELLGEEGTF